MTLNRDLSLNFGENSLILKDLNETQLSQVTRGSAEKDFNEYKFIKVEYNFL